MNGLASAVVVGRLTRDAELKYAASGTAILAFAVATSRKLKDGEKSSFWDFEMFGKRAESLAQYLKKGGMVAVSGEMYQDSWEKDGQKHTKTRINVADVQLLGGGQEQGVAPSKATSQPDNFPDDIPF